MIEQSPKPIGGFLTDEESDKIAQTIYNRYYYEYGLKTQYKDSNNAAVRKKLRMQVKETLDALAMNGFKVVKSNKTELGREFLVKKK